jgi:hypothetical protein
MATAAAPKPAAAGKRPDHYHFSNSPPKTCSGVSAFTYLALALGAFVLVLAPRGLSPHRHHDHHHEQSTNDATHHHMYRSNADDHTFAFAVITDNPFAIPHLPECRKNELLRSVRMNLDSPFVSSLHLLNQVANDTLYPGGKLRVYDLGWRSTFLDAIRYANAVLPPNTMFAIANADIVFSHETVGVLPRIEDPSVVVALSRHEVHEEDGGRATLHEDPSLSQDAWLMRTPFPEDPGFDFPMGTLGSDNKLAYIFKRRLNKTVVNWCHDVVIWHFHSSQHRAAKARIPQPYEKAPSSRVDLSLLSMSWGWRTLTIRPLKGADRSGGAAASGKQRRPQQTLPVLSIVLDLPRLSGDPMTTSKVDARRVLPVWSDNAVAQMQALAKERLERLGSGEGHHGNGRGGGGGGRFGMAAGATAAAAAARRRRQQEIAVFFLDAPWHLLFAPAQVNKLSSERLVKSLMSSVPLTHVFALIPEDVVPALCRGMVAKEWREIRWGAIDAKGAFKGEVICPPFAT